jgi:HD-GYP domain-containing protein (c-di-GMP phosphodiesterase class II)
MDNSNKAYIGKQLGRDLFNDKGLFVLPAMTLLNADHLRLLERHGIYLDESDIIQLDSATFFQIAVDDCAAAMERVFEQVKINRRVPVNQLRAEVLPFIHEVTEKNDFYGMLSALQSKDDYTYRHNIAVGIISTLLGKWLKMDTEELAMLTIAATLHDIGKIMIPEEILIKAGPLTDEEFQTMKKHTTIGYELIRDTVGTSHMQALVALQHHERMDGSGYPFGVMGHRITDFSKIVAVADVFHAMISDRSYRKASPLYEVLKQLGESTFGKLDPYICRVFMDKLMQSMIGNEAQLTDGRMGRIILILPHDPLRPLINIEEEFIDLSKERSLGIVRVFPQ